LGKAKGTGLKLHIPTGRGDGISVENILYAIIKVKDVQGRLKYDRLDK